MNSTRLFAIIVKELRQLRRDRLTFGMILGIPTLQLLLFGFAINLDIRHIDAAIVDQAQTARSRSRTSAMPVNITRVMVRIRPISPGTVLTGARRSGL